MNYLFLSDYLCPLSILLCELYSIISFPLYIDLPISHPGIFLSTIWLNQKNLNLINFLIGGIFFYYFYNNIDKFSFLPISINIPKLSLVESFCIVPFSAGFNYAIQLGFPYTLSYVLSVRIIASFVPKFIFDKLFLLWVNYYFLFNNYSSMFEFSYSQLNLIFINPFFVLYYSLFPKNHLSTLGFSFLQDFGGSVRRGLLGIGLESLSFIDNIYFYPTVVFLVYNIIGSFPAIITQPRSVIISYLIGCGTNFFAFIPSIRYDLGYSIFFCIIGFVYRYSLTSIINYYDKTSSDLYPTS